jgi:putative spermidine/putrescine transport system substrate-binding protein
MSRIVLFFTLFILISCDSSLQSGQEQVADSWEGILSQAKGSTLTMMMWKGDPLINRYMEQQVVPVLKSKHNINLEIVAGQGNQIVSTLMAELEAGRKDSEVDVVWINGETFYQLRQINALYGPFTDKLPNNKYVDWKNPFIALDFQQRVDGFECPWGNVQMTWIYNSEMVPEPPRDMESLENWLRENPGKFTLSNDFTGMTVLKSWYNQIAGGGNAVTNWKPDEYEEYSAELWDYINRIKPYFWNKGETFPAGLSQMHQMFASGELWFTMSNNDAEVDNKVAVGLFPRTSKAYVPDYGSIQNTHYLGITGLSPNKAAALVVCNYLISPEAQLAKLRTEIWGDGTVLKRGALPEELREKFKEADKRQYAPMRYSIAGRALLEPDPRYMIHLFEDFRKKVIEAE